jgi:hypothetical protein
MTDLLRKAYNACDPQRPADTAQYYDCSDARGQNPFAERAATCLEMEDRHARFLFTGHQGCGKSSELEALRARLESGPVGGSSYCPVVVRAGEYLDPYDTDTIDILLAIVTELAATLREQFRIELQEGYFAKRFREIKELLLSDVELEKGEIPLLGAKVQVQRLRRDPQNRQRVREALERQSSTILDEINLVLLEGKNELSKHFETAGKGPVRDFVLILDDLEKIRRFGQKSEGLDSQRELFLERSTQLTSLLAHVVYTIPLFVARDSGVQLQLVYGNAPFVLPMVKVFHRGKPGDRFDEGCQCLKDLLSKRLTPNSAIDVFAPDALDFLVDCCGGHIRQLLQFVREAITYARAREIGPPLPLSAAEQAIRQTVATYSTMIPESHWPKLLTLDASADQKIAPEDKDYLEMLEKLSVLEYVNGAAGSVEPWYAVHPIVRRLERFQSARKAAAEPQRRPKPKKSKRK